MKEPLPYEIFQCAQYENTGDTPLITPLTDIGTVRVVLFSFKAGQQLQPHQAMSDFVAQVHQGQVAFTVEDQTLQLATGQVLLVHAHTTHAVTAITEAKMVLTLSPSPVR